MSSFKKIKKASKYADCKNSGKGSLLKYYGVKTERRVWTREDMRNIRRRSWQVWLQVPGTEGICEKSQKRLEEKGKIVYDSHSVYLWAEKV